MQSMPVQFKKEINFMIIKRKSDSPPEQLLPAYFLNLVCLNFQGASMSPTADENVVRVSNSLDPDETQSYSVSHLDPRCLHMALWL